MQFPERHDNHTLEQKSETFLRLHLPQDWNLTKPNNDYGIDLIVEICEEKEYRGLNLIIQLKSSGVSNRQDNYEKQTLKVSTFNYLKGNLNIAILIKFIEEEKEAYWMLVKDIDEPNNQDQENFTVYIPIENKLTTINWDEIINYIRSATDVKIAANKVFIQQNQKKTD
jgi:uncharacterized protein DUF4365